MKQSPSKVEVIEEEEPVQEEEQQNVFRTMDARAQPPAHYRTNS